MFAIQAFIYRFMTSKTYSIILWITGILIFFYFFVLVWPYFSLPIHERPFHPDHALLKPGGDIGHKLGTIGTVIILIGVTTYSLRKRWKRLWTAGSIRYWMNFHIFCCVAGPALILFHTALKIGGLVSISFWSMVAVVLSGIVGRFFYTQIPRSVSGLELSVNDVNQQLITLKTELTTRYDIPAEWVDEFHFPDPPKVSGPIRLAIQLVTDRLEWQRFKKNCIAKLDSRQISHAHRTEILSILFERAHLIRKKSSMHIFQHWLHLWHVFHLPFALIMGVVLLLHIGISIYSGYGIGF